MSARRKVGRGATVALTAGVLVLLTATLAQAHVRVFSQQPAVQGATDVALTFRVPTEENSDTVKVAVTIPTATPLLTVLTQPKAGWSVAVVTSKLPKPIQTDDGPVTDAVSEVTWTATGSGIAPGSYDDFTLDAGVLPTAAHVAFPTVQTYTNGDVVRWIEPTPAGGDEPDHPVPVLELAAAGSTPDASGSAAGSAAGKPSTSATTVSGVSTAPGRTDSTSRALAITALVLAVLAILAMLAVLANAATGRRRTR